MENRSRTYKVTEKIGWVVLISLASIGLNTVVSNITKKS